MSTDKTTDSEIDKQIAEAGIKDPALIKAFHKIHANIKKREDASPLQLEMWPEKDRGVPNELSRSALFPAIHPKKRTTLQNQFIAAQGPYSIHYTGIQLDQSYLNVFLGIMHLARGLHEGNLVRFSGHQLLKLIGRPTGGADHKWLYTAFQTLTATSVAVMKDGKRVFWGSLLPRGEGDLETGKYAIEISRQLASLFDRGFTRIEWEQRRKLLHKPLAQWLQFYYARHAKPLPVSVTFLRDTSGSGTQALWKFRQNLKTALAQIQEVGVIDSWLVGKDDLVHVTRTPSQSQKKYIENNTATP
jgi:hypothetical protein